MTMGVEGLISAHSEYSGDAMKRIILLFSAVAVILVLCVAPIFCHLCDNVFRQADKLIVKPETYNLVIKDKATFKVFLQNNMDRGIAEISLQASSPSFVFNITPDKMAIPKDQRSYFEVTMTARGGVSTGNYPVSFRLVGGGREFKSFSMSTQGEGTGSPATATSQGVTSSHLLILRRVNGAIKVDGVLDDGLWSSSAVLSNFASAGGGKAQFQTVALLTYGKENLNIGIRCADEDTSKLITEDKVDIFIAFQDPKQSSFHIAVNSDGKALFDRIKNRKGGIAWNCVGARYNISKMKKTWFTEVSIPFNAFGISSPSSPGKWYLRVERNKASGRKEKSYWAADNSGYNNETGFGQVIINP